VPNQNNMETVWRISSLTSIQVKEGKKVAAEKILLREMERKDWQAVHEYASQHIVCKYQPWGPNTEAESAAFVDQVLIDAQHHSCTRFVYSVFLPDSLKVIGAGELNIRDIYHQTGEISYIIHPDYWGKGYGTELAKKLIEIGFSTKNLHRIYATCDPRNIASAKVLKKSGMTEEGRLREDMLIRDGWRDSLLFSILEHEWT